MILINYAWEKSFAQVETNKVAIAERGWFPLNHKPLINTKLRSTMTDNEQRDETGNGVITPYHEPLTLLKLLTMNQPSTSNISPLLPNLLLDRIYRAVCQHIA